MPTMTVTEVAGATPRKKEDWPPIVDAASLPMPRLELRWKKMGEDWTYSRCNYSLILPLGDLDCRNKRRLHENSKPFKRIRLGYTNRESGAALKGPLELADVTGYISTPFRDGVHIAWDSARLGLPAYVVCGDKAQLIEPIEH